MNTSTTKNTLNKKDCNQGILQVHLEPPLTPLMKYTKYEKSAKDFARTKLIIDPTSARSDLNELKTLLFHNGKLYEFLFFFNFFNITLEVSGNLVSGARIQFLRTMVHVEALHQFYTLYAEVKSIT